MYKLIKKIQVIFKDFTPSQKLVAEYVISNYSKIPFITITTMSQEIGVSDTTIINFCSMLGYDSFSSFKKIFIDHIQSELAIYNNFESRIKNLDKDNILYQISDTDKMNIETTLNKEINKENFYPFLDMLDKSTNIYICGMRSASILMDFFAHSLSVQGYNVIPFDFNGFFMEQLTQIEKEDLFIHFSFSRYTLKSIKALEYIYNKNIPSVSFTDSILSPTYKLSDLTFICETNSYTYQASYVGVLSLLNAIITETALRNKEQTKDYIEELEHTFDYFNTFSDDFE